jgi:hypothetical protein
VVAKVARRMLEIAELDISQVQHHAKPTTPQIGMVSFQRRNHLSPSAHSASRMAAATHIDCSLPVCLHPDLHNHCLGAYRAYQHQVFCYLIFAVSKRRCALPGALRAVPAIQWQLLGSDRQP